MKPFNLTVLLFCLVTYGYGRPSDGEVRDEIAREAKKDKHFQHDNVGELPQQQTESSTAVENVLSRLKSIAHLRTAETKRPTTVAAAAAAADSITREELEALKDLLDRNLQKYQNYDEHSTRKRPAKDPYIGQIIQSLNTGHRPFGEHKQDHDHKQDHGHIQDHDDDDDDLLVRQMPIRRKIIRHTVFASPLAGSGAGNINSNRLYGGGGGGDSRIEWSSPWAEYFPILIKDPLQTMMNSFSEIIEYGAAADICRHTASDADDAGRSRESKVWPASGGGGARPEALKRSRRNTAATQPKTAAAEEEKGVLSHVRPFKPHHQQHQAQTTTDHQKVYHWATDRPATEHNGDTGPQIKRLVVRRGGVAIAGPGGIATAGSGGTAIVGPGGSAYSTKDSASGATADVPAPQPPAVSMAGYGPQMMMHAPPGYYAAYQQQHNGFGRSVGGGGGSGGTAVLSSDGVAYTFPEPSRGLTAVHRGRDHSPYAASTAREIALPDGAKLIATGPIVYYNPEPSRPAKKKSRKGKKSSSSSSSSSSF